PMGQDGPGRRAVQVTHKNTPALHFRAYSVDLVRRIESSTDYNLLPSGREARDLLSSATPVREWSAALPATADYKAHRTFVTPPLTEPGLYVIVASAREDFAERDNRIVSTNMIVGDLVLITRPQTAAIEARVLSGDSGAPVAGADVTLYRFDWNRRHAPVETQTTGADGLARFDYASGRENVPYFLLVRRGKDRALDASYLSLARPEKPAEITQSLLYTDRSIYRPGQTIAWKVLVFHGRRDLGRFESLPESPVTVSLVDANGQKVDSKTTSTNAFGTASGQFSIPAGRAPGAGRNDRPDGAGAVAPHAQERLGEKTKLTYRYAASADVTDEGGETRSDTRSFRVGFVGVEAAVRVETSFFREGASAEITVTRTDLNGAPSPG